MRLARYGLFLAAWLMAGAAQAGNLQDLQGNSHTLDEYTGQGHWLVVMYWASDCHVCNTEVEQYIQFHEEHKDKKVRVLGISLDGQQRLAQAKEFMKRHHVTFPTLIGEPAQVAGLYQQSTGNRWIGTPTIVVYTPKGELVAAQAGAVPTNLIEDFIQDYQAQAGQPEGAAAPREATPDHS